MELEFSNFCCYGQDFRYSSMCVHIMDENQKDDLHISFSNITGEPIVGLSCCINGIYYNDNFPINTYDINLLKSYNRDINRIDGDIYMIPHTCITNRIAKAITISIMKALRTGFIRYGYQLSKNELHDLLKVRYRREIYRFAIYSLLNEYRYMMGNLN